MEITADKTKNCSLSRSVTQTSLSTATKSPKPKAEITSRDLKPLKRSPTMTKILAEAEFGPSSEVAKADEKLRDTKSSPSEKPSTSQSDKSASKKSDKQLETSTTFKSASRETVLSEDANSSANRSQNHSDSGMRVDETGSSRMNSGVLRVVLSDDIEQVGVDEVDEISQRRKDQQRAHVRSLESRTLESRQTTERSIKSENMLAPPQFEHEKLVEKLGVLAAEQSRDPRFGNMPPPTPIVIPPTPLLERAASAHSLNSNLSEKENRTS